MRLHSLLILCGCLAFPLLSAAPTTPATYVARYNYGAKFEVPDRVIHGAGQSDEIEFANYVQVIGGNLHPRIYMAYTSVARSIPDQQARIDLWRRILDGYPQDTVLQLGLAFSSNSVGYEDAINTGTYDENLTALAQMLESLDRPVMVRVGYEANGFWNGYTASKYVPAFQRITNKLREGTSNIAIVWCTHPVDGLTKMMTYYPGDAYVDWWSIDLFENKYINPVQAASRPTFDFLAEAHRRGRPVIIGESTPHSIGVLNGETSWNQWFAHYFNLIRSQPGIKAFCYINRFWSNYAEWSTWGDARLESNATVAQLFRAEMQQPFYQHAEDPGRKVTRVLTSVADTYAESGAQAGTALGVTDPNRMRAGGTDAQREAFLRFDLAAFSQVEDASLWAMTEGTLAQDTQAALHLVADNTWTEAGLTWNNRPALGAELTTLEIRRAGSPRLRLVDLRDPVRTAVSAGAPAINLGVSYAASGIATIHTRERRPGQGPQLVVHGWLRQSYAAWATEEGLAGALASADSDGDGWTNGQEYQFGTDPLVAETEPPFAVVTAPAGAPAVRYLRARHLAADPFVARFSADLSTWDLAAAGPSVVLDPDPQGDGRQELVEIPGPVSFPWFSRLESLEP